jgi:hypothetical protein
MQAAERDDTSDAGARDSAAAADAGAASAPPRDPRSVFFIQRNKNRNEVHYGVHVDEQCRPLGGEPVYNYWLRLEEGPDVTKPVQLFQQAGYGISRQTVAPTGVEVVLRALDERPITIVTSPTPQGCGAEGFLVIAGTRARFDKAFVFAEDGLVLPDVKYVELYGTAADGTAVRERVDVD